jgi:hypothetical protein
MLAPSPESTRLKPRSEGDSLVPAFPHIHAKLWPFDECTIYDAPESAGVYALWRYGHVIFYGEASGPDTLRIALAEHLAGLRDPRTQTASHCSWELSVNPESRLRQLLSDFWGTYHRMPSCNRGRRR